MNTEEIKHVRDLVLADMLNGNDKIINGIILRKLDEQLTIPVVSNSLKIGMQTFDLCDCPYQINTWIEKYNIQADNIISINQEGKQVVLFYKAFNDC
jgi:hypothetical protein